MRGNDFQHLVYYYVDDFPPGFAAPQSAKSIAHYKPNNNNPSTPPKNSTTKVPPKLIINKSIISIKSTGIINASRKTPAKTSNLTGSNPSKPMFVTSANFRSIKNVNLIKRFS